MVGGIVLVSWIVFSFLVGFAGEGKKITYWGAFGLSLILSPLVGLIIALCSSPVDPELDEINALRAAAAAAKRNNDTDRLKQIYLRIAQLRPDHCPNTCFKLARLYANEGDREAASFYLRKALKTGFVDFEQLRAEPVFKDEMYREIVKETV